MLPAGSPVLPEPVQKVDAENAKFQKKQVSQRAQTLETPPNVHFKQASHSQVKTQAKN